MQGKGKNDFGKKIRGKQESGLTAVQLKRDPPVPYKVIMAKYGLFGGKMHASCNLLYKL